MRKPFALVAKFGGDAVEDFRLALEGYGIECGGFASLEAALLAAWMVRGAEREAFAAFGEGGALVVPARRGANPGPQSIACGMRHYAADEANWVARLRRALPEGARAQKLNVTALSGSSEEVCETLHAAGFANVKTLAAEECLADAAMEVLKAKENRNRPSALALANPFVQRRKFSNGWILAAVLAILSAPAAFRLASEARTTAVIDGISREAAAYRPLEQRVAAAKKALSAERSAYDKTEAVINARYSARRPLYAFVDVAYFFCKFAGETVLLESIVQDGDKIEVTGTYVDPEDGVRLGRDIVAYAREKKIEIVENSSRRDGEADLTNRFRMVFDTSRVGRDEK